MLNKSILFLFLFFFTTTHAQSVNELIDLFTNNPNGTARFEAMGGAFGALGGDLSSININPAGSAVFNDNEYGFTIGSEKKVNKTVFFNNQESKDDNKFSFNQGGAVWLLKILEKEILIKFHLVLMHKQIIHSKIIFLLREEIR